MITVWGGHSDALEVQAGSSPTDNTSNPGIIYVCQGGTCTGKLPCKATVTEGVGTAIVNATLRIAGDTYSGGLVMNRALVITLQGNWDEGFTGRNEGPAVVGGALTIQSGSIVADGVVVE